MLPLQLRRRIAAWALLAVLAVQWLALGHAVQHTSGAAALVADESVAQTLGGEHDAGSPLCRLLDQLLAGQGVGTAVTSTPACAARHGVLVHAPASVERVPAPAYRARAPPSRA
jgi:hypothetical protein